MNKEEFTMSLQAALLLFDGIMEQELKEKYQVPEVHIAIGKYIYNFVRTFKLQSPDKQEEHKLLNYQVHRLH